jgi:hypothetical protein
VADKITYLVRLNGAPWFTVTVPRRLDSMAIPQAIARGEQVDGVEVEWVLGKAG